MGRVKAFFWDFDGTLADTRTKNFRVSQAIVEDLSPRLARTAPVVLHQEEYDRCHRQITNWREFYLRVLGFSEDETDRAGLLWTDYQLQDQTHVPLFPGVGTTLARLRQYPHAVVSQNASTIIQRALSAAGVEDFFHLIVGYEEVPIRSQKPAPDGLLICLERIRGLERGFVLFIGDHPTDIETAQNANQALRRQGAGMRVISVAAVYSSGHSPGWEIGADFVAESPEDILKIKVEVD